MGNTGRMEGIEGGIDGARKKRRESEREKGGEIVEGEREKKKKG